MNKAHSILLGFVFSILAIGVGCSSSGGGDTASTPTTESSYPDVAGTYSFTTGTISISCSDGSSSSAPAVALNFDVTQDVNRITLINTTVTGGIPGINITDSTDATGNLETNGDFVVNQTATGTIDGIDGTVTFSYTVDGTFTTGGWSGTYTYIATAPSLGGSCTYSTLFSGDKIVTGIQFERVVTNLDGLPPDIYDTYGHIARAFAQ